MALLGDSRGGVRPHRSGPVAVVGVHPVWGLAAGGVALVAGLMLALFWGGVQSAVWLWLHSSAYNHSILILPVFAFMVWSARTRLAGFQPRPTLWGGCVIAVFSGLWLLAHLSGVAEVVQFAIVGMMQGVLLTVLGGRIYLRLLLPFSYLWLLVPSGQFLVPGLQELTARSAVWLLELVGIPAFRDGIAIEVASGSYLVAPGCAGLNFVLASLAASMAYAELIYRSWPRQAVFVLALLALAVGGNALRVFLIIAIAHLSDNVGNIADDHIFYGWAFFSVLLLGAMALGQRFRQDGEPEGGIGDAVLPAGSSWSILTASVFAALLVAASPALVWGLRSDGARPAVALPHLSCGDSDDAASAAAGPDWPSHVGQVDSLKAVDCGRVHFVMAGLDRPVRLGKLVGVERWVTASDGWSRVERRVTTRHIGGHTIPVQADLEVRGNRKRLIWSLFWVGDGWRVPGWPVALADLKMDLLGHRRAILVLAATSADEGEAAAEAVLRTFLDSQPLDLDTPFRRTR